MRTPLIWRATRRFSAIRAGSPVSSHQNACRRIPLAFGPADRVNAISHLARFMYYSQMKRSLIHAGFICNDRLRALDEVRKYYLKGHTSWKNFKRCKISREPTRYLAVLPRQIGSAMVSTAVQNGRSDPHFGPYAAIERLTRIRSGEAEPESWKRPCT